MVGKTVCEFTINRTFTSAISLLSLNFNHHFLLQNISIIIKGRRTTVLATRLLLLSNIRTFIFNRGRTGRTKQPVLILTLSMRTIKRPSILFKESVPVKTQDQEFLLAILFRGETQTCDLNSLNCMEISFGSIDHCQWQYFQRRNMLNRFPSNLHS